MMRRAGFTLVELMLVLAILAMMVAFVAPALAKSSRARNLEQEALRFVALTELARDEAVSQGVTMAIFVEAQTQRYGMEPASATSGVVTRKDFTLHEDLHFEPVETKSKKEGRVITFSPEGTPDVSSVDTIKITDKNGATRTIERETDGWGYQLAKEETK
jgi:type II secretion system protein H